MLIGGILAKLLFAVLSDGCMIFSSLTTKQHNQTSRRKIATLMSQTSSKTILTQEVRYDFIRTSSIIAEINRMPNTRMYHSLKIRRVPKEQLLVLRPNHTHTITTTHNKVLLSTQRHHWPRKVCSIQRQRLQRQNLNSSNRLFHRLSIRQGFLAIAVTKEERRGVGEGVDPCYVVEVASWPFARGELGSDACAPCFEGGAARVVAEAGEDCAVGEGGGGYEEGVGEEGAEGVADAGGR